MLHRINTKIIVGLLASSLVCHGCKKYLAARPDKTFEVISTLKDLQSLMEPYYTINQRDAGSMEANADNYYITDDIWKSQEEEQRNTYIWKGEFIFRPLSNDWSDSYNKIYIANTVIDGLKNVPPTIANATNWNNILGQALFLRSKTFFDIALTWAKIYDAKTANTDLGIPLRLNPDFNQKSIRSSMQQTYDQIIEDLRTSVPLLPEKSSHVLYASRPAAEALLARVFLSIGKYDSCFKYINLFLKQNKNLINYNTLDPSANFPFAPRFSCSEIIYDSEIKMPPLLAPTNAKVDSVLYNSYDTNDLRKTIFFKMNSDGSHSFKGSYYGTVSCWSGISTDEAYLMRAECYAREGDVADAMDDLNTLLINRYKTGTFIPFKAFDATEALDVILTERRKELVFRNLRWMDIKRLNREGRNITLKRIINGQTYILPPNDLRYALPIPEDIIKLAGIPQNPR